MALEEGQFKIGNTVFGNKTVYPVSNWDTSGYSVVPGDYQPARSDNLRFGNDFFTPASVSWDMAALDNKYLDSVITPMGIDVASLPVITPGIDLVDAFQQEWKADEIRNIYGSVKPVTYKRGGVEKRFYGRPRRFASAARTRKTEWIPIVADYQRADLFTYDEVESFVVPMGLASSAGGTTNSFTRTLGNAPSWCNIFVTGPIVNPVIQLAGKTIRVITTVAAGKVLNICSYPWERRVINSDGLNLRAFLTEPYLDQVFIPPKATSSFGLYGTGTSGATALSIYFRNAYNTL